MRAPSFSPLNVLLRISLLLAAFLLCSPALAHADGPLLWLAAGARGAPCSEPIQCATRTGLSCVKDRCLDAGGLDEFCRPYGDPAGATCDEGLGCSGGMCSPAGGSGEMCRSCSIFLPNAFCDACDAGLGCDTSTRLCAQAGSIGQPCREYDGNWLTNRCNQGLACVMGECVEAGGLDEPCGGGYQCDKGLFCNVVSGSLSTCQIEPRGKIVSAGSSSTNACVSDVPASFAELAENTGFSQTFSFDAHEGGRLPPNNDVVADFDTDINGFDGDRDHVQSIVRLPGSPERYLISRSANDGGPAGLMIANRSDALFLYEVSESIHPGGLATSGNRIAVAVEDGNYPCNLYDGLFKCPPKGWIDIYAYDASNASNPLTHVERYQTGHLPGGSNEPSSVAITRLPDGSELLFMLGRRSGEAWLLRRTGAGSWSLMQHFPDLYGKFSYGFFSLWRMYQNIYFVTDCSGELYLIASAGDDDLLPKNRDNFVDLFKLTATDRGEFDLVIVDAWMPKYETDRCMMRYSGNPIVTSSGDLHMICSSGLTSIADGENIGVAIIEP